MAGTASLSLAEKKALVKQLLLRESERRVFPLSKGQQALWFVYQENPESPVYNEGFAVRLVSPYDVSLLHRIFQQLVDRHGALRTRFGQADGQPYQEIMESPNVHFTQVDASGCSEAVLRQQVQAAFDAPYALDRGEVFRVCLFCIDGSQAVLMVGAHHIVCDGWSMNILLQEIIAAYNGEPVGGRTDISYEQFVRHQQLLLESTAGAAQRAFWEDQLRQPVEPLDLPYDRLPGPGLGESGDCAVLSLGPALSAQLKALAQQRHMTLYTLLLSTYQLLLHRYGRQDTLRVGTPVANRTEAIFSELIGYFVNALPIYSAMKEGESFSAYWAQINGQVRAVLEHQNMPLTAFAEAQLASSALFDTFFYLQTAQQYNHTNALLLPDDSGRTIALGPLSVQSYFIKSKEQRFPLSVEWVECDDTLTALVRFKSALFETATIHRLLGHYRRLLEQVAANPEGAIRDLTLLDTAAEQRMLEWSRGAKRAINHDQTFLDVFRQQVAEYPDKVALRCENRAYTYAELEVCATKLAHFLANGQGAAQEARVGLCMERSEYYVIGMLGILMAGGAFVPLDPKLPAERLEWMVAESDIRVLLTAGGSTGPIGQGACFAIESVLAAPQHTTDAPRAAPRFHAHALAYVIYTSGSTGKPKGAMVEHGGMLNHLQAKVQDLALDAHSRIALTASISFDIAVWQGLAALACGGTVVVYPQETILEPLVFLHQLSVDGITILQVVPSYLSVLLDLLDGEASTKYLGELKSLIVTGEAVKKNLLEQWFSRFPGIAVMNAYGPTEASDDITHHWMHKAPIEPSVPIGRPIQNMAVYVLDENRRPCPIGVKGEIYTAGIGVGRGYLGDSVRTAQAFLTFEIGGEQQRLYRTGDLGKYNAEGLLLFCGRRDNQVKVRGYRIELGEIEEVLGALPMVKDCAVLLRAPKPGTEPQICAFAVLSHAAAPAQSLATALHQQLPVYMVPSDIYLLDALPLTPNGKIDRLALAHHPILTQKEMVLPETDTETTLRAIWMEALKVEAIGIHDSFFDWGGHSLKAMRVQGGVLQRWGIKIPFRNFFEHATIARMAAWIDAQTVREMPEIPLLPEAAHYPLAPGQKRLWIIEQSGKTGASYNMYGAYKGYGSLDREALTWAIAALEQRYEVLRTRFVFFKGQPVQVVLPSENCRLPLLWRDLSDSAQKEIQLQAEIKAASQHPFNIEEAPLLRVHVWELEKGAFVLLFVAHHIIADAWSLEIMAKAFQEAYNAFLWDEPLDWPPLPIQYKDYASWINQHEASDKMDAQRRYWLDKLSDLPSLLPLRGGAAAHAAASKPAGATASLHLPQALTQALSNLTRQHDATLFMGLVAVTNAFLFRIYGQTDLVLGTTSAGRSHPLLQDQLGFFVNTFVLRTQLHPSWDAHRLMEASKDTVLSAYENQDYPLDTLVDQLSLGQRPLFNVLVDYIAENLNVSDKLSIDGLALEPFPVSNPTAKFPLSFRFIEHATGLQLQLEYATDLFSAGFMGHMLGQFQQLLEHLCANTRRPLSQLPLLPAAQLETVRAFSVGPSLDWPILSVLTLFEQQVERTPNAPALVCGADIWTYRQLDRAAGRVAQQLSADYQLMPGEVAALLDDPSDLLVVYWLGILKTGAAFLPIDPMYPAARIRYMLEDAGAKVLITDVAYALDAIQYFDGSICPIQPVLPPTQPDVEYRSALWEKDQLAYVLYTSGSTGKPKGVEIGMGSLAQYLLWANQTYFDNSLGHPMPLFTSIAFDLTLTSVFSPLLRGDALHLYPGKLAVPTLLTTIFAPESPIRAVKLTPSHLELLRFSGLTATPVEKVIVGGEALLPEQVAFLTSLNPALRLFNEYGPTEATVGCSMAEISSDDPHISIGKPIANAALWVMDDYGNPLPIGVAGELYIGGAGLAKGYRHKPEQTAQQFIPNPQDGGLSRLYRTGDLARWSPAGTLEYLGRKDQQVKINGYRIEIGEIEQVLASIEGVKQSAVLPVGEGPSLQLFGFVGGVDTSEGARISAALALQLPPYMRPSQLYCLAQLPLTPNGKIDRNGLLHQVASLPVKKSHKPPQTPSEQLVARIWERVLQQKALGLEDRFFDLGGDSLKAVQIMMEIQQQAGVALPFETIFEASNLGALAAVVAEAMPDAPLAAMVPLEDQAHYPLSYAQRRLWFIDQLEEQSTAYIIAGAKNLSGRLDRGALALALDQLIARHESLRTVFSMVSGEPRQQILAPKQLGFALAYTDLRQDHTPLEKTKLEALQMAATPFDLSKGPLLRAHLICLQETAHVLLFNIHHIISDGWSMEVLLQELFHLYEQGVNGKAPALPPLPIQYKDFAVWQHQHFSESALQPDRQYWMQQFLYPVPLLQMPTDFPRPRLKTYESLSFDHTFSAALTDRLIHLGKNQETSLFSVLFTAVSALLHRYTGQEAMVLGTPVAGRDRFELRHQIGFFLNTLPIRVQVRPDVPFNALLTHVKEQLLGAYQHQQYPFDKLVEDLQPERDTSRSPLFDVLLVSEDFNLPPQEQDQPSSVALSDFEVDLSANKFDLTFYFKLQDGCICFNLAYNTALFTAERAKRLIQHLQNLMMHFALQPELPVGKPDYLMPDERESIVYAFNDTLRPYPFRETLHGLFERQAALQPTHPALCIDGQSLSYEALNARANRLAHRLIRWGVKSGDNVGLYSERHFDMVVGMLGILKAGAAYVPIDPNYPKDRCLYILQQSDTKMVIVDHAPRLEALRLEAPDFEAHLISGSEEPGDLDQTNPLLSKASTDLAYVIFTSGSTGRPKGVMIEHHAAVNLIQWVNQTFSVGPADRLLCVTSMCFDLSVYDIFGMLAAGGTVVLARQEEIQDVDLLQRWMQTERITFWDSVPSTLNYLVAALERGEAAYQQSSLRLVFLSGDWIPVSLPKRLKPFFPNAQVISLGGATEGTVWSNYYPVVQVDPAWPSIPYGKPLDNNFFYILDGFGNPVPQGVTGELYIGGVGVARGYINDPEKTENAFVPDPFCSSAGGRMYKTGDLGRLLPEGDMEFLGRRDHQVKIRGFRVELGEIETVLNRHPLISDALIATVSDASGNKQIAAYYTPQHDAIPPDLLRSYLAETLPDYMLPSFFIALAQFPLNANGKIDRSALPLPHDAAAQQVTAAVAPRTVAERQLSEIWQRLLETDRFGVTDNFFNIGGHSLAAAQMVAQIAAETGINIRLRTVFLHPTIEALAAEIETLQWVAAHAEDTSLDTSDAIIL